MPPRRPKTTFDDTKLDQLLQKIPRLLDDRAHFYGVKEGKNHKACMDATRKLMAVWKSWQANTNRHLPRSTGDDQDLPDPF